MKELLEEYFGKHYGSTKKVVAKNSFHIGRFCFHDEKACADCKSCTPDIERLCNHTVLECHFENGKVESVELESFINGFPKLHEKKCDLLLSGSDKVVFCEMTCGQAKYIMGSPDKVGKKHCARKQIVNSIRLLLAVPAIQKELESKIGKIAMFAYREKPEVQKDDFDKSVVAPMKRFGSMDSIAYSQPMYSEMENGFSFVEVRYPTVYQW